MSKHTPGRLSVDEYPVTLANGDLAHAKLSIVAPSKDPRYLHFSVGMVNFSAEFTGLYPSDVEEAEANARRLVACWNACEGIATDELEEIARTGGMLGPREDVAKIAEQRDELREALQALVDAAWLEDSHAVRFDGTVMFSPGYDFSGIDGGRRAEFREEGIEFVVWPAGDAGGNWSAYSTYDGSLWFELFETEDEAREQCMKLLDQVMPDHPISKARAALAATGEPQ